MSALHVRDPEGAPEWAWRIAHVEKDPLIWFTWDGRHLWQSIYRIVEPISGVMGEVMFKHPESP